MRNRPIPKRIPPLRWRQPVLVWTPMALALAFGWPALALMNEGGLAATLLIAGAVAFAIGLLSMGVAWMMGAAPRTRRVAILHFLGPSAVIALATPFAFRWILQMIAEAEGHAAPAAVSLPLAAT